MAGLISIPGMSGIDTASIVSALMGVEKQRLTSAQTAQDKITSRTTAWTTVSSKLTALNLAAAGMVRADSLITKATTSSDPTKVAVSGTASGPSVSFGVSQLAASSLSTITGLSSTVAEVGAGTVALNSGLSALGVGGVAGLTAGQHAVAVTQASDRARSTSAALVTPFTVTTANRSLTVAMTAPSGTTTKTLTLTTGTYASADALAAEINARIAATAGTTATAKVSGGKVLIENTAGEGSGYAIRTTGTFATAAGLQTTTQSGVNGIVTVDGTATTITNVSANGTIAVSSPTGPGTLTIGAGGHLSAGTGSTNAISFGAGTTIDQVAAALNSAGAGVTASVIGTAGSAQLLVSANASGAAASTTLSWSGFTVGTAQQLRDGQDAKITLGSQVISKATNVVSDLIPGATLTLLGTTSSDVTITTAQDNAGIVAKVKSFVATLNDTLSTLGTLTAPNPTDTSKAGVLYGDSTARNLKLSLTRAMGFDLGATATYRSLSSAGISVQRDGSFAVDDAALNAALAKDPTAVSNLLSRSVTAASSQVSLGAALDKTAAGSYNVVVTAAGTAPTISGNAFASLGASETLTVTSGTLTASYTALAGMSATTVAAGLAKALETAGIAATADVTSGGVLRLVSKSYGASSSLSVASTGAGTGLGGQSATGTNVAGTINGVAATGAGQLLTAAAGSGTAAGLALVVTSTAADIALAGGSLSLGSVAYNTGASGALRSAISAALDSAGPITLAKQSLQKAYADSKTTIDRINRSLNATQDRLQAQYAQLETIISGLNAQLTSFQSASSGWSSASRN